MTTYAVDPHKLPFPSSLIIWWHDYDTSTIPTKIPFVRVQRPPVDMSQFPKDADYIRVLASLYPYISKKEKAILRKHRVY